MDSYKIDKLKGSENYDIWKLRISSVLIEKGLDLAIKEDTSVSNKLDQKALANIRLALAEGPLLQVSTIERARDTWIQLENLYATKGFSSEFLICKEFFETKLNKFNSMEEFLNKIKQLVDQLIAKGIELSKQVIIAWLLNSLTPSYDSFVSIITQNYRAKSEELDLDHLISNLLDESRRQEALEKETTLLTTTSSNSRIPFHRRNTGNYCHNCRSTTHNLKDCWYSKDPTNKHGTKFTNSPIRRYKANKPRNSYNQQERINFTRTSKNPKVKKSKLGQKSTSRKLLAKEETYITDLNSPIDTKDSIVEDIIYLSPQSEGAINNNNSDLDLDVLEGDKDYKTELALLTIPSNMRDSTNFILDSGASSHLIVNKNWFSNLQNQNITINWGKAGSVIATGIGDVLVRISNTIIRLKDCLYCPDLGVNLLSISKLSLYFIIKFIGEKAYIYNKNNKDKAIVIANKEYNLYYIKLNIETCLIASKKNTEELWHKRMGHISRYKLEKLKSNAINISTSRDEILNTNKCDTCIRTKLLNNNRSKLATPKPKFFLDKIASDLCGPISPNTYNGYRYILLAVDLATRYLEIRLLRSKDEVYPNIVELKNSLEGELNNQTRKRKLIVFKTDNGREFKNSKLDYYLKKEGVTHEFSAPYTHEQNGIIERYNRTILDGTRALLYNSGLPNTFWGEAAITAVYLYNRTPHSKLDFKTPYEAKNGIKPNLEHIKVFSSLVYYKNKGLNIKKLANKAKKGILVGIGPNIYKIYDPSTRNTTWVRDLVILEDKYYKRDIYNIQQKSKKELLDYIYKDLSSTTTTNPNLAKKELEEKELGYLATRSLENTALIISDNSLINQEPTTYKQAISSPNKDKWQEAMKLEIDELVNQNTWELVEIPPNSKVIRGRWVFKIKTDSNNQPIKYKARWVVRGFTQELGLDYDETYSSTCRAEAYRLLLAIANYKDLEIRHWDIKNAFIHANIDKDIYVEQPIGFNRGSSLVCKLNKALYGLKQSPRLWSKYLGNILLKYGFKEISPYIYKNSELEIIVLCYVDDLLVFGPDISKINNLYKSKLSKDLKITDLGEIKQFLGIEITRNRKERRLELSQLKYLENIKTRFNKSSLKLVSIPIEPGVKARKNEEKNLENNTSNIVLYQQQIGSLIYLATKTRPDIAYAIGYSARFMSNPSEEHFKLLEKIWKYLNYTKSYKLVYKGNKNPLSQSSPNTSTLELLGYSDSDWGGDLDSRRSTSGYIFLLENCPISWNSKL